MLLAIRYIFCTHIHDIVYNMQSLFRNAIATLPSQNNDKLQANMIKFHIYYTVFILKEHKLKKLAFA